MNADLDQDVRKLFDLASRLQAVHKEHEASLGGRMPGDHRDAANLMLTYRAAEFALSATDDFHLNRPAAGAVMGRSLLETAITLRWCLSSEENGKRWWREGDAAIQRTVKALGVSEEPAVVAIRDAPAVGVGLPAVQTMAKAVGMGRIYSRWYPALSAYSHSGRLSTSHSYGPTGRSLQPLVKPCIYFVNDVGSVFSGWAAGREVKPPAPHP